MTSIDGARSDAGRPTTHAVVVADGAVPVRAALDAAWPGWAEGVDLVVAADGGAAACERLGLRPDLVVGDMDSLDAAVLETLERDSVEIRRVPRDKDETDSELALLTALERGAGRITVVGAFGGPRLDHELANVALLALPRSCGVDVALLDDRARVRLLARPGPGSAEGDAAEGAGDHAAERAGDHTAAEAAGGPADKAAAATLELPGPIGDIVSLLPLGDAVEGVTTRGLRYPLRDEPLPFGPARGISNVRIAPDAAVSLRSGRLLVVETPARLAP